jgi:hypothetical protein
MIASKSVNALVAFLGCLIPATALGVSSSARSPPGH